MCEEGEVRKTNNLTRAEISKPKLQRLKKKITISGQKIHEEMLAGDRMETGEMTGKHLQEKRPTGNSKEEKHSD